MAVPATRVPRPRPRRRVEPLNDLSGKDWVRLSRSWFVCDGRRGDITPDIERHPASFPPEVPAHLIRFFTRPGATVLDPFVGCGSTLVACYATGRSGIGLDISPRYCESSRRRVEATLNKGGTTPLLDPPPSLRVIQADARDLPALDLPPIDFCVTSPPYWNMLRTSRGNVTSSHKRRAARGLDTHYSDDPNDLGNLDRYEDYLGELVRVFRGIRQVLRPRAHLAIACQNVRPADGVMVPLAWDLARELGRSYDLRQEFIWCQDQKPLGCWGFPTTYVSNVHHHYCLILQKPPAVP